VPFIFKLLLKRVKLLQSFARSPKKAAWTFASFECPVQISNLLPTGFIQILNINFILEHKKGLKQAVSGLF
jgi:hypothetical protein